MSIETMPEKRLRSTALNLEAEVRALYAANEELHRKLRIERNKISALKARRPPRQLSACPA